MNGARYIVESMTKNVLLRRSAYERGDAKRFLLPRVRCDLGDEDIPLPVLFRTHLPVRACFAITTRKSQEHSFGGAHEIDVLHEFFTLGHL